MELKMSGELPHDIYTEIVKRHEKTEWKRFSIGNPLRIADRLKTILYGEDHKFNPTGLIGMAIIIALAAYQQVWAFYILVLIQVLVSTVLASVNVCQFSMFKNLSAEKIKEECRHGSDKFKKIIYISNIVHDKMLNTHNWGASITFSLLLNVLYFLLLPVVPVIVLAVMSILSCALQYIMTKQYERKVMEKLSP